MTPEINEVDRYALEGQRQRAEQEKAVELATRLQSITSHPEWALVLKLIEDEAVMHEAQVRNPDYRGDPKLYHNVIRALDNADTARAILHKFDRIIKAGREAQKKLDETDGITQS